MVNIELLKSEMRSQNITIEQAAEQLGIDPSTLHRRFSRNGEKFTVKEVETLAKMLRMNGRTVHRIFFEN